MVFFGFIKAPFGIIEYQVRQYLQEAPAGHGVDLGRDVDLDNQRRMRPWPATSPHVLWRAGVAKRRFRSVARDRSDKSDRSRPGVLGLEHDVSSGSHGTPWG